MKKIKVNVEGITPTALKSHTSYALILTDESSHKKKLPIIIGPFEAQYISLVLENISTPRPLTHDLLKSVIEHLGAILEEVIINKLEQGVFFSTIVLKKGEETINIDSRTSDAVALALKAKAPIYIYKHIFEENAIVVEETAIKGQEPSNETMTEQQQEEEYELTNSTKLVKFLYQLKTKSEHEKIKAIIKTLTVRKLNEMLDIAVNNEMYEIAAYIRDEINSRENR